MSDRQELEKLETEINELEIALGKLRARAFELRLKIAPSECPIKQGDVVRVSGKRFMYRVEKISAGRFVDFELSCYRVNSAGKDSRVGKNRMIYKTDIPYNPRAIPERQGVRVVGRIENGELILHDEQ